MDTKKSKQKDIWLPDEQYLFNYMDHTVAAEKDTEREEYRVFVDRRLFNVCRGPQLRQSLEAAKAYINRLREFK